jgi:general secretion pathway protein H
MRQKAQNQSGYTLVEMLVVLALLGLATAMSLPYATSSGRAQKLEATASQLSSLFRQAQTVAYIKNKDVTVTFDRESRKWLVSGGSPQLQLDQSLAVTALTVEGQVSEKEISYRFFPAGGSTGGRIILEANKNKVVVDLNWLTGSVTWKRIGDKL